MTKFGYYLWQFRVISLYRAVGSKTYASPDFVWNWLNPIAWILAPAIFILGGLMTGFPEAWRERHHGGYRINPYYANNNKEIEWLKHDDKSFMGD